MTHNLPNTNPSQPQAIYYNGRALSAAETLGVSAPPASWRRNLPLLLSGWLGLLLMVSDPLVGLLTVVAAPLVLTRILPQQRS
jgi:hypothetical protein